VHPEQFGHLRARVAALESEASKEGEREDLEKLNESYGELKRRVEEMGIRFE